MTDTDMPDLAMIERVEALIRKAESTEFPEEAEAFYAKARELMLKHAIDEAMLDTGRNDVEQPEVEHWCFSTDSIHAPGKRKLLGAACVIAGSGTSYLYYSNAAGNQWCDIVGYAAERLIVKRAYDSLFKQVHSQAKRLRRVYGKSLGKKEMSSFMAGFALGVVEKVREAERVAKSELSESVALVLVSREQRVSDLYEDQEAKPAPQQSTDAAALSAGYVAGLNANIITQERLT